MMTPMILLLLLSTMLASAHARPQCTAKDMEGLQIVGYSVERVFRYTDYTRVILLDKHTFSSKDGGRSYLSTSEFGELAHLHQGFNDKLIVLQYGRYSSNERHVNIDGVVKDTKVLYLTDRARLYNLPLLAVLNITSIDPKERLDSKESGFERPYKESSAAYDFASFVYEDRLYYEGGFTNTDLGEYRYKFVPKGRDLCKGMKFPVVDIAFTPPFCHSRLLNESTDAVDPEDDEWIVSLVNGIRTTRSRHCEGWTDFSRQRNVGGRGVMMLPDVEKFCFYLLTPQMKEPCLFAVGNRHVFQEVQVAPVEPVRMAVISTTTLTTPTTTTPADSAENNSDGKVKSSGTKSISRLLSGFSLGAISQIL